MPIGVRAGVLTLVAIGLALLAAAPAQAAGACETVVSVTPAGAACPGAPILAVLQPVPVTWCYQVRNSGGTVLRGISIVDSLFGVLAGNAGDLTPGQVSAPLAFSGEAILDAHSAQATGSAEGVSIRCAPGTVEVIQATPGIALDVTAATDGACPGHRELIVARGADLTLCYAVINTDSTTTLTDIEIIDALFGAEPLGRVDSLAPGATQVLMAAKPKVTHDQTSLAIATGRPVFNRQVFPAVTTPASIVVDVR